MQTTTKEFSFPLIFKFATKKDEASAAYWKHMESLRFGLSPAILTIVTCLSGIAAAFAIGNSVTQLSVVGLFTAITITSIIAIAPMKWIFLLAVLTSIIDISVFFFH